MSSYNQTAWLKAPVCFSLLLLVLFIAPAALLASPHPHAVWHPAEFTNEDWPDTPAGSRGAHPMEFAGVAPEQLRMGDTVTVRLPFAQSLDTADTASELLEFRVVEVADFVNGDLVLFGLTADGHHALTMTAGTTVVFGQLEHNGRILHLQARRAASSDSLYGWLYSVESLQQASGRTDYVIPERRQSAPPVQQPLTLESSGTPGRTLSANTSSDGQVEVSQRFSVANIPVGEARNLELTVTVRNLTASLRQLPALEIFFLLEDTRLLQLPVGCSEHRNSNGQPFLRCASGSEFAPGETRSLRVRVSAGPETSPGRLWSSAFVGDLRHDTFLYVVRDILAGADDGGVSTFNATLLDSTPVDPLGNVIIDVLALYTGQAQARYDGQAETRINQLFGVANQIYRDSGVGITLRPVHHRQVHYPQSHEMEIMLENLTHDDHPALTDVPGLRAEYGADLVMLFTALTDDADICGLANLGGFNTRGDFHSFDDRDYAFSVIGIDCPYSSVVAHEAGHNMGLTHSHAEDGQGGTFSFATGHAEHGLFSTVMANPAYFGDAARVARFSNPLLNCFGRPCGIDYTDPDAGADAVRALNLVRYQIANYYPTRIAPLPSRQVATADGQATTARIAMAATVDGGRSFVSRITPNHHVDVNAEFYVDEEHIGRSAVFHVVIHAAGQFLQWTADGRLLEWDGDNIAALVPFRDTPELLTGHVRLSVLEQIQPPVEFIGSQLHIYVAYQVLEDSTSGGGSGGGLIYTLEPLVLDVTAP